MPRLYYIIEHPRKGVLRDLEETDAGRVGRFSWSGLRGGSLCARFATVADAADALRRLPRNLALECDIRSSSFDVDRYADAWPVVLAGREVIA